ncbi:MAG TPA: tetratricopeptide repeat protein [Gammaproteobacteria bacterium]|nr:tetratricopeptide repeat protein [Gammaproteobacteria bacterium]
MSVHPEAHKPRLRETIAFIAFIAGVTLLLAAGWFAYHPGLSGDFLFDDFGNLPILGATGPVDHWATFWRYITSGGADPTGRPLTLLSFLLDARNWPASPLPFKVTNVALHLLNAALLAAVLLRLGRALGHSPLLLEKAGAQHRVGFPSPSGGAAVHGGRAPRWLEEPDEGSAPAGNIANSEPSPQPLSRGERGYMFAALFGAGAWLLHPLFVSTTLYIVQREAMLPATFTLIGIFGWISARDALARGHVRRGLFGLLLSAWGCTLLATLSKANGALLPLLLLLVECIVLAPRQAMPTAADRRRLRGARWILLGLPLAALALWLLVSIPGQIRAAEQARGWTLGQRLLSEPRVVVDYLRLLFVPHAHSSGLFNDAFPVSTGWLHPGSTLPCVLAVLALIGVGFALRRRAPAVALALLFYFAAQLLESGWIPLELYYEHRNYLPSMLLFWPIGLGLGRPGVLRWLRGLAAAGILVWLASLTLQRASLWGDGYRQALVWAAINPHSARAQTNAALYDIAHQRPRLAAARLHNALDAHPHDLQIPVNLIGAECRLNSLRPQTLQAARQALATTRVGGTLGFKWFNTAIDMAKRRQCHGLDFATVQSLLDAARANPYWRKGTGLQVDLAHLQGMLDLAEGNPQGTLSEFDRALALKPRLETALAQAAILGSHGQPKLGLAHLDYYATLPPAPAPGWGMARIHQWVLHNQHYWENEAARLRATLTADAAARAKSAPRLQD